MQQAGLNFKVRLVDETDESYPSELKREEIPLYLAQLKAEAFNKKFAIPDKTVVVTADTIVWVNNRTLNKPADKKQAVEML